MKQMGRSRESRQKFKAELEEQIQSVTMHLDDDVLINAIGHLMYNEYVLMTEIDNQKKINKHLTKRIQILEERYIQNETCIK